jgi:hypothetical protein
MFTCDNCGKEKPGSEQGSVGWLAKIGIILISRFIWWPSAVCKDCTRQVRLFGIVCLIIVGVIIAVFGVWNR